MSQYGTRVVLDHELNQSKVKAVDFLVKAEAPRYGRNPPPSQDVSARRTDITSGTFDLRITRL